MWINELLDEVTVIRSKINQDLDVDGIASDSRKCKNNYVFIALTGTKRNGNDFIKDAMNHECICIVTDEENIYYEYDNTILVSDARIALSLMWSNYYGKPSKDLKIIGITGTNGKTSTSYFLHSILKQAGKRVGLISTVKCMINDEEYDTYGGGETLDIASAMTTPDPELLYKILYEMKSSGVEYVVMEASSHALELSKLYPIEFEAGIFTNLSQEHLDFHRSMEYYFLSKAKLFYRCKHAIVNGDDEYANMLHKYINRNFIKYGYSDCCSYKIYNEEISYNGCSYSILNNKKIVNIYTKICGSFSIYNSAAAAATALEIGITHDDVVNGIKCIENIDGRMERIGEGIYIDYAHTPDAIANVIDSVKKFENNKKITVLFGCGGDRDKSKRMEMGKIASEKCDLVILTSDNSRTEDKISIIKDIMQGVKHGATCFIIPDRRDALELSVRLKNDGVLLILGKGHEKYEIDKSGKHYFDEKLIVMEAIKQNDRVI